MGQNSREILINAVGGAIGAVIATILLFISKKISDLLNLNLLNLNNRIFISIISIILFVVAFGIIRAKKKSKISSRHLVPLFGKFRIPLAVALIFSAAGLLIWTLFFAHSPKPFSISPLVVNLVNSSENDVTIDTHVDFELLVGARVSIGTTIATGILDLVSIDGTKEEFITIPAKSELLAVGIFRHPNTLRPFFEKGDSDIQIRIYREGGGLIYSNYAFRFDSEWLDKYRIDIDVSQ